MPNPEAAEQRSARVLSACEELHRIRARVADALTLHGATRRAALYRVRFELDGIVWPLRDADGRDPGLAFAARILSDDIGRAMYGSIWALDALALQVGRVAVAS